MNLIVASCIFNVKVGACNEPKQNKIHIVTVTTLRIGMLTVQHHQQNVNQSGSNTQSFQSLWATSPLLPNTSRCLQTPLQLSKVLSDSARAFTGAHESTCSYGGAFRMLKDLTYRIVKFWSSWDLCADRRETSSEAEATAHHCRILWERPRLLCSIYKSLGAIFSQEWYLHNHKEIRLIIFIFVTVTRVGIS